MIVCSCRAVCDSTIRRALTSGEPGACSMAGVQAACRGAGGDCGACVPTIRKMIREAAQDNAELVTLGRRDVAA